MIMSMRVIFLREKNTKNFMGFTYQFPSEEEISSFTSDEIVGRVAPPEKYLRGYLKFNVNFETFRQ